jgi:hypothetical protein
MSQDVVGRGLSLNEWRYQRLVEVAEAASRLGAPEAVLDALPCHIRFLTADDLGSPSWWLDVEVRRIGMGARNHHAIVAPPAAIRDALRAAGTPVGRRYVRGLYEGDRVRFVGPEGEGVAYGRVVSLREDENVGVDPNRYDDETVAAARVDINAFKRAVLNSYGNYIELRVAREPEAGWGVYVVDERGALARPRADVTASPKYSQLVGRYPAAVLRALLSLQYYTDVNRNIWVGFRGFADFPILRVEWNAPPFEFIKLWATPMK